MAGIIQNIGVMIIPDLPIKVCYNRNEIGVSR